MNKTSDGVAGMQQSSSAVMQMMVQLQADKQASEDVKTKQRAETQRMDTAKSILENKSDYPQDVVDCARELLLNYLKPH
jgi:negative regulator of replication initiation